MPAAGAFTLGFALLFVSTATLVEGFPPTKRIDAAIWADELLDLLVAKHHERTDGPADDVAVVHVHGGQADVQMLGDPH